MLSVSRSATFLSPILSQHLITILTIQRSTLLLHRHINPRFGIGFRFSSAHNRFRPSYMEASTPTPTQTASTEQPAHSQSTAQKNPRNAKKPPGGGNKQGGAANQKPSGKLRGLEKDSPAVRLSKTLSWLLRHGAKGEGLPMRPDGYVKVTDLLENPKLKGQALDFEGLKDIVKADLKKRYDLTEDAEGVCWIRANQGHSMKAVKLELKPIISVSDIPTGVAVHGTSKKAWELISKQGLSKMKRNHIHLAQGVAGDNVISGGCFLALTVPSSLNAVSTTLKKALDAGIKFHFSDNGVVLTEGNEAGILSCEFFERVEDAKLRVAFPGWEGTKTASAQLSNVDPPTTITTCRFRITKHPITWAFRGCNGHVLPYYGQGASLTTTPNNSIRGLHHPNTLLAFLYPFMENIIAQHPTWDKAGSLDDKLRQPSRPLHARVGSSNPESGKDARRKGKAYEDLGQSFAKSSSQSKGKLGSKSNGPQDRYSGSSDEIDFLSNYGSEAGTPQRKKMKKDGDTDVKGVVVSSFDSKYRTQGSVLKGLKFKKNKAPGDGMTKSDASTAQPVVLKDHGNSHASGSGSPSVPPSRPQRTGQTTIRRARSPVLVSPSRSPDRRRSRTNPKVSCDTTASENTRPKPRPNGTRAASAQHLPQPFPDLGSKPPGSPARRMTISGPKPFPFSSQSPPRPSENTDPAAKKPPLPTIKKPSLPTIKKPKPTAFPSLSPVNSPLRPAGFPSLAPLGPDAPPPTKTKAYGTRSVSEKLAIAKPAEFPLPSPPSGSKTVRKGKMSIRELRSNRRIESSDEEAGDDEKTSSSQLKAQPFPMSTQILNSIGSSSVSGPSSLGKRSSTGSDDSRKNKKKKDVDSDILDLADSEYEEEDTITPTDPGTLCPYCDAPLPPSPTPHLKRLLASTARKSYREPRPDNPLGRNAPFAVFIAVCQRHIFESQILPQAELKGWPKSIDWTELEKRVRRMKGVLRAVIDDTSGTSTDDEYEEIFGGDAEKEGPRAKCVFWTEVMKEVKQKGSRAVAGVRGQFASFEKMQPGYYGELGSVIIHQTLYDLFPLASIDHNLVSPLTGNEFVQRILVPEVGVRLIMEDMGLDESKTLDAVRVLRESANYGVAMFPADEGEDGEGVRDAGEMAVADQIVMERARKRRKELEGVEQEEEEQMRAEQNQMDKPRKVSRKQEKEMLKNGKKEEVETSTPAPRARPRPRPVGKNSSMASVNNDVEVSSQIPSAGEGDTDVEAPPSAQGPAKRRRELSRSITDLGLLADTDATPQRRKVGRAPFGIDVNLCSSEDSEVEGEASWDTGRMRKDLRKQRRKAANVAGASDDDLIEDDSLPPSSQTPASIRARATTVSESEDGTPKPGGRPGHLDSSSSEVNSTWDIPPLQRARNRKARSAT
ncbi:hypothetical protein D9615_003785 [Tricholomella constricta]|uniref:2'-phosphotransferase n=1 Tax=Tricholomella constricta TaxID=117010 RepID=A0A8H5HHW0_9AGAR|nr:hypothetical protein D9615_003785 [Tricholomella constricta]